MIDKKAHWEKVYQDKSTHEVSWFQKQPTLSLDLIRSTQIDFNEAIIDVGGGASVLVDYLLECGYTNLSVLDISRTALQCAKTRLGEQADQIQWLESDITQFVAEQPFALWHDRAVFHFLTDENDRLNYIKVLQSALKPGGHLIIAAFAIGGPEQCSGLDIVQYDAHKLSGELGSEFQLQEEQSEVHTTPANKQQKFNYFRFVKK